METPFLPFNRPFSTGLELENMRLAIEAHHLRGDGRFSKECQKQLEAYHGGRVRSLLTHSCTAALELAAFCLEIKPGDEVILPSFTFVSTANAFVLRGATPVFVDVREDTFNLDERLLEAAFSKRTRAVLPVHYAGISCEMASIQEQARTRGAAVVEDAAQGLGSTYASAALGGIGEFGALSFHDTKNIVSGEGGAFLCRRPEDFERAEIFREKGTNRSRFYRGQVDKYTWVDLGSSLLPSELTAAFLLPQLQQEAQINARRMQAWKMYHEFFSKYESRGILRRPIVPANCTHNAHMYYVIFRSLAERTRAIDSLRSQGVDTHFHYIPLHSSPMGKKLGRTSGTLPVTDRVSDTLLRFPMWAGIEERLPQGFERIEKALQFLSA